mgnify:CR=1 FL=1
MISMELNAIFQKAVAFARHQRHEYVTIEHVMLALLNSSDGEAIIKACSNPPHASFASSSLNSESYQISRIVSI